MTKLWSVRWTAANGWHWKHERDCDGTTCELWLQKFREDEPRVRFMLSAKKPRTKAVSHGAR